MNCCAHDSLHTLGHLILSIILFWDLWCESELRNQLTLLNQFKIRLLPHCPLKCMNSVPSSFICCADISVSRNAEISPSSAPPLVLSGVGAVLCGWWGLLGHLIGRAAPDRCWFLMLGADHSCRPFQGHHLLILLARTGWDHIPLPSLGAAVAAAPFELENRSAGDCSWDIKIAGTCFSHAVLGWAVPALAGQGEWSGEIFSAQPQGGAWTDPCQGCSLGSARLTKHPCCVTLWSQVFLPPQLHAFLFDLVSFSPPTLLLTKFTLSLSLTKVGQCKDNASS